jgi:mannitol-1-/sugar-/sorbitol-6-phosphatase
MTEIRCAGILFDCDGVLVESDASTIAAWTRWAEHYGIEPDAVMAVMHGRRSEDTVAQFLPEPERAAAAELIERYEVADAARVRAIPGALELTTALPADRWAVVTSGTRALATARLAAAGLTPPAVLITADDVSRGKPDPEGYRAAAARLGLAPAQTVVLEDAPSGLQAARAAQVAAVIGVGSKDGLDADLAVADLTELRWTGTGLTTG